MVPAPRWLPAGGGNTQGKSTLLSGIGLYMLVADGEPSAEVIGCATSREQASIIAKQMYELVRASPSLERRLEIIESRKTIACVPTSSSYKVISSDSHRAEGLNISCLLADELHAFKDRRLWDALRYGGRSRSQPLLLAISTAGSERGVCWEQHEYAMKVSADPSFDPSFFPYVRGATIDDDYRKPEVWRAANPSFGVTMDEESFAADVKEAEQSISKLSSFLRYSLDIWVQGENKFFRLDAWERCRSMSPRLDESRVWYCGLDLAQTWDVNAMVAVSKDPNDGVYDVVCKFWIPGDNAHQRDIKDGFSYTQWAKDPSVGLTLTPGDTCDYDFIKRDILQFCKERTVKEIAVDPHNSHYLVQQLEGEGIVVRGFSQGASSMNTPTKALDALVSLGKLRTNANPLLDYMAANATAKVDSKGYIKIVKPAPHSPQRVDGIIALVMALALASDAESKSAALEPEILAI